ncbi:hypothetical protein [Paraburkholderia sp. J63]|uniref:hypothetical protein n=1 Tax=Paraburkholderia sp. J63 TaxID=2805434 RepID=UPI002ABD4A62|nr:hypothetical protein [Paraburkholderia sp. J63]
MRAGDQGFLLADKPLSVERLSTGIEGVRSDTGQILTLLKMGARSEMLDRARVHSTRSVRKDASGRAGAGGARANAPSNPNASRSPSSVDLAAQPCVSVERARDAGAASPARQRAS